MFSINVSKLKPLIKIWWFLLMLIIVSSYFDGPDIAIAEQALRDGLLPEGISMLATFLIFCALIVSSVLLHQGKRIGRVSFFWSNTVGIIYLGFTGALVANPVFQIFDSLEGILTGAILALAYSKEHIDLETKSA